MAVNIARGLLEREDSWLPDQWYSAGYRPVVTEVKGLCRVVIGSYTVAASCLWKLRDRGANNPLSGGLLTADSAIEYGVKTALLGCRELAIPIVAYAVYSSLSTYSWNYMNSDGL
jgi:hypothetical protein